MSCHLQNRFAFAYHRSLWDSNIFRIELQDKSGKSGTPQKFIASTQADAEPGILRAENGCLPVGALGEPGNLGMRCRWFKSTPVDLNRWGMDR